ncbi:MAG TPA: NUDIX domain-containing protein [Candidatus Saccharimonadales bacterium]|nr:NUDIX domain-containing protein [Candidatus Saccharimonadales bacterium]
MAYEQNRAGASEQAAIEENLQLMREGLQTPYRGYPPLADRLVMPYEELERTPDGRIILPDGPWDVAEHSEGLDMARTVSADEQAQLTAAGLELDAAGRPLHPWFARMIADPLIGVLVNKGALWVWGPDRTTDAVVQKGGHTLLQRRSDTGQWSIPGGFVNDDETSKDGMLREVHEETGLAVPDDARITQTYHGPVADIRLTAHAWPLDTSFLVELPEDGPLPEVFCADNESTEVLWVPTQELREDRITLFGAHRFLVHRALAAAGR